LGLAGKNRSVMYKRQPEIDFIRRTYEILHGYRGKYNVTLLINCCIGLLILPKEKWDKNLPIGDINQNEWGISPNDIKIATDYKINEVVRHLRNSIAHYRYTFSYDSTNKKITEITFKDMQNRATHNNFELTISVKNFKKFLYKFSQTMLNKMEKVNTSPALVQNKILNKK